MKIKTLTLALTLLIVALFISFMVLAFYYPLVILWSIIGFLIIYVAVISYYEIDLWLRNKNNGK